MTRKWTIQFNEDVKIPANGYLFLDDGYLLLDAESVKKLDITGDGYVVLLRRKGKRSPTMEKGDAHNRDQDLSVEETLKVRASVWRVSRWKKPSKKLTEEHRVDSATTP